MIKDIYEECPTYKNELITLRKTGKEDLEGLFKCYSDEKAVPLFNSDNCNGDKFYYNTIPKMEKAIDIWEYSYSTRQFVRWTIILNTTKEIIGTVEMFHRHAQDEFNHYGVLRVDLQSKYEDQHIIESILELANEFFYEVFDVKAILSKAVSTAKKRICALNNKGYIAINKKFMMIYDEYLTAEIWLNVNFPEKSKVSHKVSPTNTALNPLPRNKVDIKFIESTTEVPEGGVNVYDRIVPPKTTLVGEEDGKFIEDPSGNYTIVIKCSSSNFNKIIVAFGWWEKLKF